MGGGIEVSRCWGRSLNVHGVKRALLRELPRQVDKGGNLITLDELAKLRNKGAPISRHFMWKRLWRISADRAHRYLQIDVVICG